VRMYLSSFRVGDHPDRLLALMRRQGPTVVIANSCDTAPPERRADSVQLELDALGFLGIAAAELDLRDYVDERDRLADDLAACELVWVRGGNTFVLRHALAISGGDAVLTDLLAKDAIVYAGYSAGACVLAPSLHGLELCDEPADVLATYGVPARFDGLGLLARPFVPHLDSPDHAETELVAKVAARYRAEGVPFHALRDGQVLVVDGDLVEVL
jgi:dipeptidase E